MELLSGVTAPSALRSYPNPSSNKIIIIFYLPEGNRVRAEIYDSNGRLVQVILEEELSEGEYTIAWNGNDRNNNSCRSGIYLFRVWAGTAHSSGTVVLMKN